MIRVKRGNIAAKRRKRYLKLAKGYVGTHSRLSTLIGEQVIQSLNYAYVGRKLKKRIFRSLWIARINAAVRAHKSTYSILIGKLRKSHIFLDRKSLSFLVFNQLASFNCVNRILNNLI